MKNIAGLLILIRDAYGQLADERYEGMVQALYILFGLLHSYLTSYVFSCSNWNWRAMEVMREEDLVAGIAQLGEQQTEASSGVFWRSRVQSTVLALCFFCCQILSMQTFYIYFK